MTPRARWDLRHFTLKATLASIVCLFALIVLCVFLLGQVSAEITADVRSYVGGEGLWSKAEKEAVLNLISYARTHSEKDYDEYLHDLSVPLGDRQARLELEEADPNVKLAGQGFAAGRNHPDDIPGMIWLFRRFRHFPYLSKAIDIWAQADRDIDQMRQLGRELHDNVSGSSITAPDESQILAVIENIDARLTPLEDQFSFTLGDGARWIRKVLFIGTLVCTLLLLLFGVWASELLLRRTRQSDEKYRYLFNTANDAILVIDANDLTILEANGQATQYLAAAVSDLSGKPLSDFLPLDEQEEFCKLFTTVIRDGTAFADTLHLTPASGLPMPVEISASCAKWGGKPAIHCLLRDMRERQKALAERHLLEMEVRQSQKMEAVGRFAGGIAHDFNNLLMVIQGNAERLQEQSNPYALRPIETILKTTDRAAALTRQLLAFSRKQPFTMQIVNVNEVLMDMEAILSSALTTDNHLELSLEPGLGSVKMARGQLEQIIVNLTVNARDAMARGGRLKIETSNVRFEGARRQHSNVPPGEYIAVMVTDTGSGMDAATKERIFEPFFTTKQPGQGTGLGLSVVYGIIKQSDGHICVYSEPGQGSIFEIYLPRQSVTVHDARPETRSCSLQLSVTGTILVVEDEPDLRFLICEFLKSKGFQILEAGDGTEALAISSGYAGAIDLLLTDVVMPGMRGPELAARLLEARPSIRVIYVSGYTREAIPGDEIKARGLLLQKPFRLEELQLRVNEAISRSHDIVPKNARNTESRG
jgi:PAS domain S-box-containing protein